MEVELVIARSSLRHYSWCIWTGSKICQKTFGRPIGPTPGNYFLSWRIWLQNWSSAPAGLSWAAIMKIRGLDYTTAASMAKLFASEVAMRHSVEAVQVHGGYGYVKDTTWKDWWEMPKSPRFTKAPQMQRIVISRAVLARPIVRTDIFPGRIIP